MFSMRKKLKHFTTSSLFTSLIILLSSTDLTPTIAAQYRHQPQVFKQAMLSENPLGIPEVASLVASNLEGKDLASCVRVSKSWRDMFLPHRWRVTEVGSKLVDTWSAPSDKTPYRIGACPDDIYYHRHLIQDLTFHRELTGLDKYHYPNLRKLKVDFSHGAIYPGRMISLEFTAMFPSLVDLVLECVKMAPASWETLSAHPHIRNLRLYQIRIKAEDAPGLWKACERLERLEMDSVSIDGEGLLPTNVVFDRMRRLEISSIEGLDATALLDLMLRCPRLEDMVWWYFSDDVRPVLIHPVRNGRWPHLNKLVINSDFQDTDVAFILERIGNGSGSMDILHLTCCTFGTQARKVLDLHFSTLVEFDLSYSDSVPSTTIRDVLCCCPKLKILRTGSVFAQDVAEGGTWVCQQLRELKICFRVGESEQDLQPLVFERLSTLTRLEQLKMRIPRNECSEGVLEFRLDRGLGQLASLEQLTSLHFGTGFGGERSYIPQLGMDEVAWMKVNWKKLKSIRGTLNKDPKVDAKLRSALKLFDIGLT